MHATDSRRRPQPAFTLALALGSLAACAHEPAAARTSRELASVDVQQVSVEQFPIADVLVVHGSLFADEELVLSFQHAGALAELPVDLGTRVRTGMLVARLDTANFELAVRVAEASVRQSRVRLGLEADGTDDSVVADDTPAVRQAQATLKEARTNLQRVQLLLQQNLVPEASLDAARAVHDVAEGRLQQAYNDVRDQQVTLAQRRVETELARRRLIESSLYAPFDGVVAQRHVTPPEFVRAGDPLVTILRTDPLRLRLRVPEKDSGRVAADQSVTFVAEGLDGTFSGRVARLSPRIDPTTRTLLVEVEVRNAEGRLRPGLFTRAAIEVAAPRPCLTLPGAAIVSFAGVDKVFFAQDGKAVERQIRTGRKVDGRVEILDGLAPGDAVVAQPGDLVHGQPVRVQGR